MHWCPGCEELHQLPDQWSFDGNVDKPTFSPSFLHTMVRFDSYTPDGIGVGERRQVVCHYILKNGVLEYQNDCFHKLSGQHVPLPNLPGDGNA